MGAGKDLRLFPPLGAPHEVEEASRCSQKMADIPARALLQSCGSLLPATRFYKRVHDILSVLYGYGSLLVSPPGLVKRSTLAQEMRRRRRRLRKAPPTGFSGGRAREVTAVEESFDVGRLQKGLQTDNGGSCAPVPCTPVPRGERAGMPCSCGRS
ncbi:hypothetical protein CPAR01_07423 [Colletotrichum paranaense]|uniref:Uncharacterized protein n=1 Tax=Colletotrichum paranaense TaxID=1914294 RepID=A0ABQ9SQG0_9PEZI|nr:uncharacterized protein CPAR01_07423 [Colletotrichum paranaense]KAK1541434.1 hypothetical protein CPAR01_07423 [Colletotrichum paranaense]